MKGRFGWCLVLCVLGTAPAAAQKRQTRPAADPFDLAAYDARIQAADRSHWAFQPVVPPKIPPVARHGWARNPIDRFILAALEADNVRPSARAAPHALLRRIHLDLTGLPPTLDEQEAFLGDPSPEALDRSVDDLLARPSYGERWARHWLDLVRYAETNGYERDAARPNAWRYRDYVIDAFNHDRPYDRFILEQLAGDELADATAQTRIATGYCRLGPWDDEPADPKEDRFDQLDDLVNTTSQVFLGLTLACARCHDHKFEALTMHDYYRMVAVFQPLERPTRGRTELDLPAGSPAEVALQAQRDAALAMLNRTSILLRGGAPGLFEATASGLRAALPDLPRGYFLHEPSPQVAATHLLIRGKATRPGPRVEPGVPAVLTEKPLPFPAPRPPSSQRRLTLARWIASRQNPLTARVIVNRVWHHHFGAGLVRTPSDFGLMGQPPTHPELLDWLADWFVAQGWSIKKLHRLILTSATYAQAAAQAQGGDPDNRLLGRFPYRRLEAEAIADSILAVSGRLDTKMHGPSVYPFIPREALAGSSDPDRIWPPFDEAAASRRAIYGFTKRSMIVPLFEVLDVCDTSRSCERRQVTTVAPQALSLFNGDFVNRQARHFAQRLQREAGADFRRQIEHACRLALCRRPTTEEVAALADFLRQEADRTSAEQALVQMCRVIFNLNEFVYPD